MLDRIVLRPAAGDLDAPPSEVMRLLGYREGRTRLAERHLTLVKQGIELAREAAAPVASLTYCAVRVEGEMVSTAAPGIAWRSRSLARLLEGALGVSLVAATLGPGVEELARALFAREEYALATILDAAGSVLIHGLAERVRTHLAEVAATPPTLTPLYGPGYGDWPVQDQLLLVEAAGGPAIGLSSTESCYLQPQKSLVGLVGWLPPAGEPNRPLSGCGLCTLRDCAYRILPGQGGANQWS